MTKIFTLWSQSRKQIPRMKERLGQVRKLLRHQESQAGPPLPLLLRGIRRLLPGEAGTRRAAVAVAMGERRVRELYNLERNLMLT